MAPRDTGWILKSPPIEVRFAGFRSTTYELQRAGWQMASRQDDLTGRIDVLFKHGEAGLQMAGHSIVEPLRFRNEGMPPIVISRIAEALRFGVLEFSPQGFGAIDATPTYTKITGTPDDFNIFAPASGGVEEIIVEPQSVAECLELIRKLQAPELEQIRRRNSMRDRIVTQQARILTLAT